MTHRVLLGLGSNVGNRLQFLTQALRGLDRIGEVRSTSHMYLTEPTYVTDQPSFLNLAAEVYTSLEPYQLLSQVKLLEREVGRSPAVDKGPREIDVDILAYGDLELTSKELTVPHAALHDRDFVLRPLIDIDSQLRFRGKSLENLLASATIRSNPRRVLACRTRIIQLGLKTIVMGILNVTPDSFSDRGRYYSIEKAVARGLEIAGEGADIIDIGGESSRPGASPVTTEIELDRVLPIITELRRQLPGTLLSIDTHKPEVAIKAALAGVDIVNNSSSSVNLGHDNTLPVVLMHSRGTPLNMKDLAHYPAGVLPTVINELKTRIIESGLWRFNIIADPGLGFAKTPEDNWYILKNIKPFKEALNYPTLIGASNKRFLRKLSNSENPLEANLAVVGATIQQGAEIVRVHQVKETKAFLLAADKLLQV